MEKSTLQKIEDVYEEFCKIKYTKAQKKETLYLINQLEAKMIISHNEMFDCYEDKQKAFDLVIKMINMLSS